ncbi:MAG TPA: membrane protein insertion efficiency factor YidD [Opitutaceae bacterium]|nr:membrane protein insertion efficiency factor YidD [Opitutaceae bacterium]HOR24883.1 membrane protein insertion efficiency factor YidD [Opitutaceae bacterium]HPK49151.1 membrane protein insertion efficiency factor YidD [Opitutaceae bacterium]
MNDSGTEGLGEKADGADGAVISNRPSLVVRGLLVLVWIYQKTFSPLIPAIFGPNAGCRFYPSCSHYAAEALRVHGVWRGLALAVWRLLRCTPLSKGGIDPVPKRVCVRVGK